MRPRKRFGQHFLISSDIIVEIVGIIDPSPGSIIVEIGPGRGALTMPLLEKGATVYGVELERDAVAYLRKHFNKLERFHIIESDFLLVDTQQMFPNRFTLVGNIPYNITSPVIDWTIEHRAQIERACFMVQREMAERLAGAPGTKDWSPLSIFTQLQFTVSKEFDVAPEHFNPPPAVWSSVISLTPAASPFIPHPEVFEKVVRASFRQRRKTLLNNLVPSIVTDQEFGRSLLDRLGLPIDCRAEQLSSDQYLKLTALIAGATL
jgi:16S rRNA (adenine1518-N6/adenine1519-N6)-dimethyltransferase